jgi:hypothetical protein
MGGLYFYDPNHGGTGLQVTNNYVQAAGSGEFGTNTATCIYLDDLVSHATVTGNSCVNNGGQYGFIVHGGNDNLITNNYFDLTNQSGDGQSVMLYQSSSFNDSPGTMLNNYIYGNIFFFGAAPPSSGLASVGMTSGVEPGGNPHLSGNIFFSNNGSAIINTYKVLFGTDPGLVDTAPIYSAPFMMPKPQWFQTPYTDNAPFTPMPVISGCGTISAQTGGAYAGKFQTNLGGTCTAVIPLPVSPKGNGWRCSADNQTRANVLRQSASSSTSCTFTGTTVASDVIVWSATSY